MQEAQSTFASWAEDLRRAWRRSGLPHVLPIYITVRFGLTIWMFLVRQVFSQPMPPDPLVRPYLGVQAETNPWLEPWQRWDTLHYQAIAERGYDAFDSALFVPALYPGLIRVISEGIGIGTLVSGLIVSNVAALLGMAAFYSLALDEFADPTRAKRAVLYLTIFPTAFFFMAAYTESLLLLGATVALLAARRGRWWLSAVASGFAAFARLIGALVIVPVGVSAWSASRKERGLRPWLAVAGGIAGSLVFPLYVLVGLGLSPMAPIEAQSARFQGGLTFPGLNLLRAIQGLLAGVSNLADLFDLALLLLFLGLTVQVWRQVSRPLAVFYSAFLLLYLSRGSGIAPLLGSARYVLILFPASLVISGWGRHPWIHRIIVYLSAAGLLLLSGQFAIWGWVG